MKGIKKLLTGILAGAMATAMCFSTGNAVEVRAEGTGEIVISNATVDQEYSIYKVFDATYIEPEEGKTTKNAAYTYTPKGDNDPFFAQLSNESVSPFDLVEIDGVYNVSVKKDKTDSDVLTFIKNNGPVYTETTGSWSTGNYGDPVDTKTADKDKVEFKGLDYGYYFVKSTLGGTVTINNVTPTANVIDKNQKTTIDKQESVDGTTSWKYIGKGVTEDPIPTQAVGSKVNYKLTGNITQYIGEKQVNYLEFTDIMSEGLTADENVKVEVKIQGVFTEITPAVLTYEKGTDKKTTTTIRINTYDKDAKKFIYGANTEYQITYSATINGDGIDAAQKNEVTLKDDEGNTLGTDETKVVNYKITLTKTDAGTGDAAKKLADAHFLLYSSLTGDNTSIPVVKVVPANADEKYGTKDSTVDNVYRVATAKEIEDGNAVTMVTGKTGVIVVKGLKNGSYYFEETQAPAGYNKLEKRVKAIAKKSNDDTTTADDANNVTSSTENNSNDETPSINDADVAFTVVNTTGTLLPSTGGIGTTIFYIIGGVLIIAGVAYFIVRRKADAE